MKICFKLHFEKKKIKIKAKNKAELLRLRYTFEIHNHTGFQKRDEIYKKNTQIK